MPCNKNAPCEIGAIGMLKGAAAVMTGARSLLELQRINSTSIAESRQ